MELSVAYESYRHVAFRIELEDKAKSWLQERNIDVVNFFEFEPHQQPVVPPLYPHVHAAVYFEDPMGTY